MHPVLFKIGDFVIPAYGALLAVAFLVSAYLLKREAARLGQDPRKVGDAAIWGLLIGLLGSKLLLILIDLPYYLSNPQALAGTIRSAGVMYGGIAGGTLGVIWYIRRHKMPLWSTLDLMAPFLALAVGIGRLGCLAAGCCWGQAYEGPLALHFPDHPYCEAPAGVGLFPIQVVALFNGIALFSVLLFWLRRRSFHGQIAAAYFVLYGLTRGTLEFWRGDDVRGLWLGGHASTSQLIAILGILLGLFLYIRLGKDRPA